MDGDRIGKEGGKAHHIAVGTKCIAMAQSVFCVESMIRGLPFYIWGGDDSLLV